MSIVPGAQAGSNVSMQSLFLLGGISKPEGKPTMGEAPAFPGTGRLDQEDPLSLSIDQLATE